MFKKYKGPIRFEFEKGEFVQICELNAKNCARDFFVLAQADQKMILFRDGDRYDCSPGRIYPFSKDPKKKKSLFNRKACERIKIVCLATDCVHRVEWGASEIMMKDRASDKTYRIGAVGDIYFMIGGSIDAVNAFCHNGLVTSGFSERSNEQIKESIRDVVVNSFVSFLTRSELYTSLIGKELLPDEMLSLNKSFCSELKPVLAEFGIDVKPYRTLISRIVSKEIGK